MRMAWRTDNPPEEREEYLVTYESGCMDICQWTNVNRFWTDQTTEWHWRPAQYCKVIAWLPLPEEYKPQETGEWIENATEGQDIDPPYICSACGYAESRRAPFCGQCGADMGENNE